MTYLLSHAAGRESILTNHNTLASKPITYLEVCMLVSDSAFYFVAEIVEVYTRRHLDFSAAGKRYNTISLENSSARLIQDRSQHFTIVVWVAVKEMVVGGIGIEKWAGKNHLGKPPYPPPYPDLSSSCMYVPSKKAGESFLHTDPNESLLASRRCQWSEGCAHRHLRTCLESAKPKLFSF
jgi:hypothetical protein